MASAEFEDELEELQHYFDVIQASDIVNLKFLLPYIQAKIREHDNPRKSEGDVEGVNREFLLKGWQILKQIALAKISRHDSVSKIAEWKKELSSPAIDAAPPVTLEEFIETETSPDQVLPDPWFYSQLSGFFPTPERTVRRQLSARQHVEEQLESEKISLTAAEDKILHRKREFAELMKFLKSNAIPKKRAAESPPYAAKVQAATTSATAQSETCEQRAARRKAVLMPLLEKQGWTLSRLITAVGCGKNTIYRYADGRIKTSSLKVRQAIADELKVKLEQIPE